MTEDLRTWDAWRDQHQPFELSWWKEHLAAGHSCDDNEFERIWKIVKDFIRPHGRIIDIGCGPRPPFAPCAIIEPLAEQYKQITPASWWDGVDVFAQPAETLIDGLRGDTVICWNCLDHTIGWREILDNMMRYGSGPDATFAVATDFYEPFLGHPGFDRTEFMVEIERRFDVVEAREPFDRQLALVMRWKTDERWWR